MGLGVYCECDKCLPVTERDTGRVLTCDCGKRVVVPLLEEFRAHPLLLSAATLERRVHRLINKGELPGTDACLRCGDAQAQVVHTSIECERSRARPYGGQRFLFIPLPFGFHASTWHEEEGVEIRGRDTEVPAPVALCGACHQQLLAPTGSRYLLGAALLLAVGGIAGYLAVVIVGYIAGAIVGVVVAAGVTLLVTKRRLDLRTWQRKLKGLLGTVPIYRQVLERYARAVVVIPHDRPDVRGDSSTSRAKD